MRLAPLLLLLICGCVPTIPRSCFIDTDCNLCIVEGEINGKQTYFIIDTGAGITCVDLNQSSHFGFSSIDDQIKVGGYTNDIGEVKIATGIESIKIKDVDISGDVIYTHDMSNLVRFIEQCSHKRIGAIIGVPVIIRHGLVIDLTNQKLYKN
jgi:hypothetical protein